MKYETKHANPNQVVMERKEIKIEVKADGHPDRDGMFRVEALGSTFGNVDLGDDVMVKGCFTESLKTEMPVILWQHDRFEPIGMPEKAIETNVGLELAIAMPADDTFVAGRVMPQIRIGSIKAMSIGFRVIDFHIEDGIRFITKARLREVSFVTFPMNEQAKITAVKCANEIEEIPFAERSHPWNSKEAIQRLKEFTDVKEEPNNLFSQNFMRKDSKTEDAFDCFKMCFVDVVDGNRVIVPRALFSIKNFLSSNEALEVLQEEEKSRISSLISKYISKLNEEQPITMLNVEDVKKLSRRDLEKALRDSGLCSKEASVIVASGFQEASESLTEDDATIQKLNDMLGLSSKSEVDGELSPEAKTKLENMVK